MTPTPNYPQRPTCFFFKRKKEREREREREREKRKGESLPELPPEPPRLKTTLSSSPPSAAA
ncbi:hypothetical protein Bca101_004491 [Brassica carinata]